MATAKQYRDLTNITADIATKYPSQPLADRTPVYRDITFSDITATTAAGSRAGLIWGLPEAPASNIILKNITIKADKPFGIFDAKGITIDNCKFESPDGKSNFVTGNAEVTGKPQ